MDGLGSSLARRPRLTLMIITNRRRTVCKLIGIFLLTMSIFITSYQPAVAEFDGSEPLLCAAIKAIECGVEDGCRESTVGAMNIPQFITIDFKKNMISPKEGDGSKKGSEIKNLGRVDDKLIMQGTEGGRGWSMIISETSGKMSATVTGDQFGFVVFGACTTL